MAEISVPAKISDLSEDIRPDVEQLACFDGDPLSISEEDIALARLSMCGNSYSTNDNDARRTICEAMSGDLAGSIWRVSDAIDNLASKFSNDNPVHEFVRQEGMIFPEEMIKKGYALLEEILLKVKAELAANPDMSNREKAAVVYKVMTDVGIVLTPQFENWAFFENLSRKRLDCDTSSYVIIAVAHELGWPVHIVYVPGHVFIRWQDKNDPFNIDYGLIRPDKEYEHEYFIDQHKFVKGNNYFSLLRSDVCYELSQKGECKGVEAEAVYREAIRLDPEYPYAHSFLADLLYERGKYKEAEAEFRKAIRLDHEFSFAHWGLGNVLKALGEDEEAEREFHAAHVYAHYWYGRHELSIRGKYEEAVQEYRKAIELAPAFAPTHKYLGNALIALGQHGEALAEYREAIRLDPKFAFLQKELGDIMVGLGKYNEAEAEYRKAIRLDPKDAAAHIQLGLVLSILGKYNESETEYRRAVILDKRSSKALDGLGFILSRLGKHGEAATIYRKALDLEPNSASFHSKLGSALKELKMYDEAEAEYELAIKLDPKFFIYRAELIDLLLKLGIYPKAEVKCGEAIAVDRENVFFHDKFGVVLTKLGKYSEAEAELRDAIRLEPGYITAYTHLALVLYERGRYLEAEAECRKAISIYPGDADTYKVLVDTLIALGRTEEAEAAFCKLAFLDPDTIFAHHRPKDPTVTGTVPSRGCSAKKSVR